MSDLIQDLEKKIDLQRGVHSFFEIRSRRFSVLTKSVLIIFPAFLTFVAFSDYDFLKTFLPRITEDAIRLSIGIVSFILFVVGTLTEIFGVAVKHEKHREAIEQYSELRREMRESGDKAGERADIFNQRYISISSNAVPLNSAEFRKAEKHFLQNNALREARKRDPFGSFCSIRRSASQIAKAS